MDSAAQNSRFDFDAWRRLAAGDPARFEHCRRRALEAFIEAVPAERRPRLLALQWQVEQARSQAAGPAQACLEVSRLLWEHALGPDSPLVRPRRDAVPSPRATVHTLPTRPARS